MKALRKWRTLSIVAIIFISLAALLVSAIALAQSENPVSSSEPVGVQHVQNFSPGVGIFPDEDGYTGPRVPVATYTGPSSEGQADDNIAPGRPTQLSNPQPDEDRYYNPDEAPDQVKGWSDYYYLNVAGATLRPRSSTTGWSYASGGCEFVPVGSDVSNIHLDLPDKSLIEYLRIYYYDVVTPTNTTILLSRYNGAGEGSDIASLSSTGNSGYGMQESSLISVTVSTKDYSYVLNWLPNSDHSDGLRLCGARIAYRLPIP
jgi:hypothetical protein